MSQHVSQDFVEINGRHFNLSFIIVKSRGSNDPWSHFFCRTPWISNVETPQSFYTLDLGVSGRHTYYPCAPFLLVKDECSSWLEWEIVPPNSTEEDEIKMLHFINDPAETLSDTKLKTRISAHPCIIQWADQLSKGPPPVLGNLNRMEELVKSTLYSSTRSIPNIVSNRLRQDMRDLRDLKQEEPRRGDRQQRARSPGNRSYDRSPNRHRSPRRPRSPQQYSSYPAAQPLYGAQHPQPQQLMQQPGMIQPVYAPQQQHIPQQQPAQQQPMQQQHPAQQQHLNPQQQQWNNGIQTLMQNQPQPGLLYAPQRTNTN